MAKTYYDNAGRPYKVGVGGGRLYLNVPPKQEELEEGINDPLGNSEPDINEDGSEKGIGMPWEKDETAETNRRNRRSKYLPDDPLGPLPGKEEGINDPLSNK